MDFSIIFEHSQIGVKVQKKKNYTGIYQAMKPQIGSFSIDPPKGLLSLAGTAAATAHGTPAHCWRKFKWLAISPIETMNASTVHICILNASPVAPQRR